MGAGSLLALMARHSLLPARQHSRLAPASHIVSQAVDEQPHEPAGDAALHIVLKNFHLDLEDRLQQLQIQGTGGSAHLNWLLDALASMLSTHSSLQSTFNAAANFSSGNASLVKHRADEVLHMLDVCTALKQVADDMECQFGCLQHSLQSVEQVLNSKQSLSNGRLRAAAHRLSTCLQKQPHTNILCVAGKHYTPLAEARSSLLLATKSRELQSATTAPLDPTAALLSQALDGTLLTSLLALAAAVSSLEPPSRRKCSGTVARAGKGFSRYLSAKSPFTPWAAPLRQLHQDLKQEEMSAAGSSLFREVQGLHYAATKLHATITAPGAHDSVELAVVKRSVESLEKSLREVQPCISMLRMQLASSFQALIALRLTLLDS